MLLSDAINELVIASEAAGLSPRTVKQYQMHLQPLVAHLGDCQVGDITTSDLRRFINHLRSRTGRHGAAVSPATLGGYARTIRRLFNFLVAEEVLIKSPASGLAIPKLPKGQPPKAVALDDFLRMMRAIAGDDPEMVRARAVMTFLAETGCRAGGLVGLRMQDLDIDSLTAQVIEKGNKYREVYFTEFTSAELRSWLAVRPDGSDWVFVSLTDKGQLNVPAVTRMLKRVARMAGVTGPANAHAFRHMYARTWLMSGGDLATLSQTMGHSDITVTAQAYSVFLPSELQQKHRRHSVAAAIKQQGDQQ
ncbi:MAG: tyrosine-type recombinase/integrase [Nitrosomonas ureae]